MPSKKEEQKQKRKQNPKRTIKNQSEKLIKFNFDPNKVEDKHKTGLIRIGKFRCGNFKRIPDFTPVYLHGVKAKLQQALSPHVIKRKVNGKDAIFSNELEFSKVYDRTIESSPDNKKATWFQEAETHIGPDNEPTDKYWEWREKGMRWDTAVRFPNAYVNRDNFQYMIIDTETKEHVTVKEALKTHFIPIYQDLIKDNEKFTEIRDYVNKGHNILIVEVDGPDKKLLNHYIDKYSVAEDFISDDSVLATPENLGVLFYDDKTRFGYGYWVAMTIMGLKPSDLPEPQGLKFKNKNWDKLFD